MIQGAAESELDDYPTVRELSRPQRRVIGTLLEKGFTTPDQYPLTIKACMSGCNQKSNRDPISNYSEDQIFDLLDELRQMGLVAMVHTESGRTERYRHYIRKRFSFTEPQLAILTELLLRGHQSLGELRGRANRMVPIDSLDILREELQGMIDAGFVESDGPLSRRGVEVDHTFYPPNENRRKVSEPLATQTEAESYNTHSVPIGMPAPIGDETGDLRAEIGSLRIDSQTIHQELVALREEMEAMRRAVDDLRQQLGG